MQRRRAGDLELQEARRLMLGEHGSLAERLSLEPDVGEQVHAGNGQDQRDGVAACARAHRGKGDHGKELDRRHGAQRKAVDRDVETGVHHREHGAPREQQALSRAIESLERATGAAPQGEYERRPRDPQPGHTEDLDAREEEHRERRSEVVEDRADDEVHVRRHRDRRIVALAGFVHCRSEVD
jgi:hypothetical protein